MNSSLRNGLRPCRERHGLSELALTVGVEVSHPALHAWEVGRTAPSVARTLLPAPEARFWPDARAQVVAEP